MSLGSFREVMSRRILIGIILAGRLGVGTSRLGPFEARLLWDFPTSPLMSHKLHVSVRKAAVRLRLSLRDAILGL